MLICLIPNLAAAESDDPRPLRAWIPHKIDLPRFDRPTLSTPSTSSSLIRNGKCAGRLKKAKNEKERIESQGRPLPENR
jgi:hypothetical protein